jgi:hypothetical protein
MLGFYADAICKVLGIDPPLTMLFGVSAATRGSMCS